MHTDSAQLDSRSHLLRLGSTEQRSFNHGKSRMNTTAQRARKNITSIYRRLGIQKPSFIIALARSIDLTDIFRKEYSVDYALPSATEDLKNDWKIIGEDMRFVMDNFEKEIVEAA